MPTVSVVILFLALFFVDVCEMSRRSVCVIMYGVVCPKAKAWCLLSFLFGLVLLRFFVTG